MTTTDAVTVAFEFTPAEARELVRALELADIVLTEDEHGHGWVQNIIGQIHKSLFDQLEARKPIEVGTRVCYAKNPGRHGEVRGLVEVEGVDYVVVRWDERGKRGGIATVALDRVRKLVTA